jgi:hypothetical protein
MTYQIRPITVQPGVQPLSDSTPQSTAHWTFSDKVRFKDGFPEKIGGWDDLDITGNYVIHGVPRSIFSYVLGNTTYYIVGTHTNLYSVVGNSLFNATPVVTTGTTLNNVLSTYHRTLGSNPFAVVNGSTTITVTDAGHPFMNGDIIQFSGASAFAGLSSGNLNGAKSIANVTANTYQFNSGTIANSTTSGGGAAVVRASRIVKVNQTNDYRQGDNIYIDSVQSTLGGITPANIVGVHVLRNPNGSTYDIEADAFSTASVMNGGGDVVIRQEIPDGQQNSYSGSGYGLGQYGVGLYGVSKSSSSSTPPTIWSFDRFGDLLVATPGNQSPFYSWDSSTNTLPAPIANAPMNINYAFVSDNIAVTLGADDVPNRVKWSDQGNLTVWNATAQNQAGEDDKEGIGELISHAKLRGLNLIFTRNSVHTLRYIGKPNIWEFKDVDSDRGLIGRNARVVVNGICYWMGLDNFYMYRGGNVEIMPSNTTGESTLKDYVFGDIDPVNALKAFAWYNSRFNEIWFHYPSIGSQECNRVARVSILDRVWVPDTFERTAAEYPSVKGVYPYLSDQNGTIFRHENGSDANGEAMTFTLTSPYFDTGVKETLYIGGLYPDSTVNQGNISVTVNTKRYPQQAPGSKLFTMTPTDSNIAFRLSARYWQYVLMGSTLGQYWRCGSWKELVKKGSSR